MKALFIRCYGKLSPEMLVGGLIDMGVPPVFLDMKRKEAGLTAGFIEKANSKAQFSAHYFRIPDGERDDLLLKQDALLAHWNEMCDAAGVGFKETGWRVISALCAGASAAVDEIDGNIVDLRRGGVREEDVESLYAFLCGLSYLEIESVFVAPFELAEGNGEAARMTEKILTRAGSTAGKPVPTEGITPFAAAMLEALAEDFTPMDGRFLADRTAYGTDSAESPDGDNTVALYLGYFTESRESVFNKTVKIFGTQTESIF